MNTSKKSLATILSRTWWVILLRGLTAIVFGILSWLLPEISLTTLVLLFGAYALADGALGIWVAITGRKENEDWWVLLLWAFIGVGIGVVTFLAPDVTTLAILFYIAAWALATGVLQIAVGIHLRKAITGEWRLILAGLASVVFSVLLMAQPGAGALALLWLIATYAIIFGILLVILAFEVRAFGR